MPRSKKIRTYVDVSPEIEMQLDWNLGVEALGGGTRTKGLGCSASQNRYQARQSCNSEYIRAVCINLTYFDVS